MPKLKEAMKAKDANKARKALESFDPEKHKRELLLVAKGSNHEPVALKALELLGKERLASKELLRLSLSRHDSVGNKALEIMLDRVGGAPPKMPDKLTGVALKLHEKMKYLVEYEKSGGDHEAALAALKEHMTDGLDSEGRDVFWTMRQVKGGELKEPEIPDEIGGEELAQYEKALYLWYWFCNKGDDEETRDAFRSR